MNLIDEINKEREEMGIQSETVNSPVLSDTDSTIEQVEKPKKKRGRPAKVQNEIFVEMWNAALDGGSLGEIATSLGISAASCSVKASNMRKAGFNLPQFKRGRPKKEQ
tara:strand:+ start:804 stop:1127 length:324 start_codon:yes stop_codon:yes gene_type:complete